MRCAGAVATLVAPIALLGGLAQSSADARPALRVVDRTMLCATSTSGVVHEIQVHARGGVRSGRRTWDKPPVVRLTTGSTGSAAQALDNAIGWILAGRPSPKATVIDEPFTGFTYPIATWGAYAASVRCRPSRARVPLTRAGLRGGPAGKLGVRFDCPTPRRVLVRLRARFETAADLRRQRQFLVVKAVVVEGSVTVRTESGVPLLQADVTASGTASLFTARRCVRD